MTVQFAVFALPSRCQVFYIWGVIIRQIKIKVKRTYKSDKFGVAYKINVRASVIVQRDFVLDQEDRLTYSSRRASVTVPPWATQQGSVSFNLWRKSGLSKRKKTTTTTP